MTYFSKFLSYSTSNAQLTEEPFEQPIYADKNNAQYFNISSQMVWFCNPVHMHDKFLKSNSLNDSSLSVSINWV